MTDEIKSNLEPLEESDLNLKEKFAGTADENKKENGITEINPIEKTVERQEGVVEKEAAYAKILSKTVPPQQLSVDEDIKTDAEVANQGIDAESKISNLVNIAQAKGIPHAVKVARHMEDNYTLDEFHDRLLGEELHQALIQKGMIREV